VGCVTTTRREKDSVTKKPSILFGSAEEHERYREGQIAEATAEAANEP
jgi:hypothetical protein